MKNATFLLLAFVLALAGCSGQDQSTPQSSGPALTAAPPPETPAPAAVQPAKPTSPERIAEIEASGQTGMWATVTEVCPKDIKTGLRTMLVDVAGRWYWTRLSEAAAADLAPLPCTGPARLTADGAWAPRTQAMASTTSIPESTRPNTA